MSEELAREREEFDEWRLHYWRNVCGFGGMLTVEEHREWLRKSLGVDEVWAAWQAAKELAGSAPCVEALRNLANTFHEGRAIAVDHKSEGYVMSVVEAAEQVIDGARLDGKALLGEVWMAFGVDDGRLIALPEYAAASARAVGDKIMEVARREGYRGSLRERMEELGWSVLRVTLADGLAAVPN
jgi:hypothetical protein